MAVKEQVSPGSKASVSPAKPERRIPWGKIGRYTAVVFVVSVTLAPLYWSIAISVKSDLELNVSPPTLFPYTFSLANYASDLALSGFTRDLLNSTRPPTASPPSPPYCPCSLASCAPMPWRE